MNWKDIEEYEGLYQVSDTGEVKCLGNGKSNNSKERILKVSNNYGYLRVCLCKDGKKKNFRIHRLVAEAFIPNPLNLPQVNHKDEDKTNNRVDNLEWVSAKENSNYGTHIERVVEKNKNGKCSKPILQFSKTGEFIKEYPSTMEIERQLGYYSGNISRCCKGKYKSAYGFIWKYKKEVV